MRDGWREGLGGRDSERGGQGGVRKRERARGEGESAQGVASLSSGGGCRGSPQIESLPSVGGHKHLYNYIII